eukprot:491510_1
MDQILHRYSQSHSDNICFLERQTFLFVTSDIYWDTCTNPDHSSQLFSFKLFIHPITFPFMRQSSNFIDPHSPLYQPEQKSPHFFISHNDDTATNISTPIALCEISIFDRTIYDIGRVFL